MTGGHWQVVFSISPGIAAVSAVNVFYKNMVAVEQRVVWGSWPVTFHVVEASISSVLDFPFGGTRTRVVLIDLID